MVLPILVALATMTIDTRLAISAYSIAVAPFRAASSFEKYRNIRPPPALERKYPVAILKGCAAGSSEIAYKTGLFPRKRRKFS
jgi:hypothetical protein